jgi:uncharacterized protein (DUF2336 family)
MDGSSALLQELEAAVSRGTAESRLAALSYTTDLLITGRYSDDQTWMFGEVIGLLASEIEATARAHLANRLAPCSRAPTNIISKLAFDDSIDVAGPVLRHSEQLSVQALIENAKSKSQAHLLAISQRRSLHEDVTDVLLSRGDQEVVRAVVKNDGARFSESGFWRLVHRSENDVVLALDVGARKDIPRHVFQKLIARASDEVKERLAAANPEAAAQIQNVVTGVTEEIHTKFGPATRDYFAAKRVVEEMCRAGELNEDAVCRFARARKFEEVTVALSLCCGLPVDVVERALLDDNREMVVILAKAMNLSWTTTQPLLSMSSDGRMAALDLDNAQKNFSALSVATAKQVIQYYKSRREQRSAPSNPLPQLRGV